MSVLAEPGVPKPLCFPFSLLETFQDNLGNKSAILVLVSLLASCLDKIKEIAKLRADIKYY